MTVSTTTAEEVFPCNGVQTVFSVSFSVVTSGEVKVLKRNGATDTLQTLNVDYTLTGVGGASGFTVTMAVAPANLLELVVYRQSTQTQDTLLTETGGFNLTGIMAALDKQTRTVQEATEKINRSLRVRVGEPEIGELVGGTELNRASRAVVFSATGAGLEIGPTASEIAGAQAQAVAAAASASAAAASAIAADVSADAALVSETNSAASAAAAAASALEIQNLAVFSGGDGTAAAPTFTFDSDTNTGMYRAAADTLAFATAGVEQVRITSNGILAIGITPPAWDATFDVLHVGQGALNSSASGFRMTENVWWNGASYVLQTDGRGSVYSMVDGYHYFSVTDAGLAGAAVGFTTHVTIEDTGAMGIGTSSPLAKLHVRNGTHDNIILRVDGLTGSDEYVSLGTSTGRGSITAGAANTADNALSLRTAIGGSETTRFVIGAAGAWGIGNSADEGIQGEVFRSEGPAAVPSWGNAEYWALLNATYTLTSSVATQKLFNVPANGALTLPVGTYQYEALVYLTAMSATSGNAAFNLLGAGSATIASALSLAVGIDSAIAAGAAGGVSYWTGAASNAAIVPVAVNTALGVLIRGTFRVSVAGTIIPSVALTTAAAAVVQLNSSFKCKRIGKTATDTTYGPWA